jgi:hypothetical protein
MASVGRPPPASGGKAQLVFDCTLHLATLGGMLRIPSHQTAVRNLQNTVGLVSVLELQKPYSVNGREQLTKESCFSRNNIYS